MGPETISIIVAMATFAVVTIGTSVTLVRRLEARTDARFEQVASHMDARFSEQGARIDGLSAELTEVKISIARLEGTPPRLMGTR
ncbi:hypothetical protein [Leucobacter sp. gxy201]|uniref:hypothetical protein n=1 Tax=Leucobacter sp. gxy201 TaxID=2957200 RepID=UPI003D9FFD4C